MPALRLCCVCFPPCTGDFGVAVCLDKRCLLLTLWQDGPAKLAKLQLEAKNKWKHTHPGEGLLASKDGFNRKNLKKCSGRRLVCDSQQFILQTHCFEVATVSGPSDQTGSNSAPHFCKSHSCQSRTHSPGRHHIGFSAAALKMHQRRKKRSSSGPFVDDCRVMQGLVCRSILDISSRAPPKMDQSNISSLYRV